jgi:L-threonylcarbamoyladenylate synthase
MPSTTVVQVSSSSPETAIVRQAAQILREGNLVAFPTETVYGLGADALNHFAVEKVFQAKGRPADNPLIVHIASFDQISEIVREVPPPARTLADCFWPGPLTLVMKKTRSVPDIVTAHLDSVAVRIPRHPVTLALLRELGRGMVGPSANRSGRPSPTEAQHVIDDLAGRVDYILDAGPTEIGVESTVLDVTRHPPLILRQGGLSRETIEAIVGNVTVAVSEHDLARSPGTRHRHYAPNPKVVLVAEGNARHFAELVKGAHADGARVGAIVHSERLDRHGVDRSFRVEDPSPEAFARLLFRAMRDLEKEGVDLLIIEEVKEQGIGAAVMDRLRRASSHP